MSKKNPVSPIRKKVFATVALGVLLISLYFSFNNYRSILQNKEKDQLDELKALTSTLALSIDGNQLQFLLTKYKDKDAISDNLQDPVYASINQHLLKVKKANAVNSDIYLLCFDPIKNKFFFGPTSAPKPYFRHEYTSFPEALKDLYNVGGHIPPYEDAHGIWISAFAPVKDGLGNTVAVVQADKIMEDFEKEANEVLLIDLAIAFGGTLVIMYLMFVFLGGFFKEDARNRAEIARQNLLIQDKNNKITHSINYAKKIQDAIMGHNVKDLSCLSDFGQIFIPKDIVSGDFLWYKNIHTETCDHLVAASADCTGHGVPGALMSMLGFSALNEAVLEKRLLDPSEILPFLNEYIVNMLNQREDTHGSNRQDGLDIALCVINFSKMEVSFAGAHNPLVILKKEDITPLLIKGSKFSIGGIQTGKFKGRQKVFESQSLKIAKGDRLYLFSDGIQDQFGKNELKGRPEKFKRKRLIKIMEETRGMPLKEQCAFIEKTLKEWQAYEKQTDDISLIALEI